MPEEPRCPQCQTVVQPDWDWCHACGFDPDGHRAAAERAAAPAAPAAPGAPTPPAPPPAPAGPVAGWYPDPGGEPLARYWDGVAWTGHVRDLTPPSAPPAPPAPAPTSAPAPAPAAAPAAPAAAPAPLPEGVLIDVEINQPPIGKKRLVVTRDGLTVGKTAVDFGQVSAYTFWVIKQYVNGVATGTDRRLVLVTPQGTSKIVFGEGGFQKKATKAQQADAFEQVVDVCDQLVGVRLCREASAAVGAGQSVSIGKLVLDPAGFTAAGLTGKKTYAWSQLAGARLAGGEAQVFVREGDQAKKVAAVPMKTLNAVLLPRLLPMCADALGY